MQCSTVPGGPRRGDTNHQKLNYKITAVQHLNVQRRSFTHYSPVVTPKTLPPAGRSTRRDTHDSIECLLLFGIGGCKVPTLVKSLFKEVPFAPYASCLWTVDKTHHRSEHHPLDWTKFCVRDLPNRREPTFDCLEWNDTINTLKVVNPIGVRSGMEILQESTETIAATFHIYLLP